MKNKQHSKGMLFSKWFYGKLLYLYPATFRKKHGSAMRLLFSDMLRDAHAEGRSFFFPWMRVICEIPVSVFREHMAPSDALPTTRIVLQFSLLNFQYVVSAMLILVIQFTMYFVGIYFLFLLHGHPTMDPMSFEPSNMGWNFYSYNLLDLSIFACSTMIAFWILQRRLKTLIVLFTAEIGVLLFFQLLSLMSGAWRCTALMSLTPPICGISFLNPFSIFFGIFFLGTAFVWGFILSVRRSSEK